MNEIDWSRAPGGADKYNTHNGLFYKGERSDLQVFMHEQWKPSAIIKSNELFVYRPATPSWSGEGLPPVGVVCEFVDEDDGYIRPPSWPDSLTHGAEVEILAHYAPLQDSVLVAVFAFKIDSGRATAQAMARCFRPIRTPEQSAADERGAAVDAMVKACPYPGSTSTRLDCEALYDAGYREP